MQEAFYEAVHQLPPPLVQILGKVSMRCARNTYEIRLRADRPLILHTRDGVRYVGRTGEIVCSKAEAFIVPKELLKECFYAACGYSLHTAQRHVDEGFVTLSGGHRVGICGSMTLRQDGTYGVREAVSLNVRIARQVCCEVPAALREKPENGMLIAAEPMAGKTTLLRSMVCCWAQRGLCVSVADERRELFAGGCGVDVQCDVFSGYPKQVAMQHALRAFAPDILVCDEIGTPQEVQAVVQAVNAGVVVVASIHASGARQLAGRPAYRRLIETGAFSQVVFLKGRYAPGEIQEVRHVDSVV